MKKELGLALAMFTLPVHSSIPESKLEFNPKYLSKDYSSDTRVTFANVDGVPCLRVRDVDGLTRLVLQGKIDRNGTKLPIHKTTLDIKPKQLVDYKLENMMDGNYSMSLISVDDNNNVVYSNLEFKMDNGKLLESSIKNTYFEKKNGKLVIRE